MKRRETCLWASRQDRKRMCIFLQTEKLCPSVVREPCLVARPEPGLGHPLPCPGPLPYNPKGRLALLPLPPLPSLPTETETELHACCVDRRAGDRGLPGRRQVASWGASALVGTSLGFGLSRGYFDLKLDLRASPPSQFEWGSGADGGVSTYRGASRRAQGVWVVQLAAASSRRFAMKGDRGGAV